jgi:hypothetical protein
MSVNKLACIALLCALTAHEAQAAPVLSVTPLGLNGSSNRDWAVDIAPDPAFLPGSMAVELAFAIDDTELLGVDVNTLAWDHENPGSNPFTGTVTDGLWLDLIGDRTFGAFGSVVFNAPGPVRLFTIETLGGGDTTIRYGTAASGDANKGNIIAQFGEIFRYSGSATVPEPATTALVAMAVVALANPMIRRRRIAKVRS